MTKKTKYNQENIIIKGAKLHNLKNISLNIPKNKLVVISGVSGSGKSSLAFDTLYAEGQRRYIESLSSYARQFLGKLQKPDVDEIIGISPAIAIEQKVISKNPRSTVGTTTEIYDYLKHEYKFLVHKHQNLNEAITVLGNKLLRLEDFEVKCWFKAIENIGMQQSDNAPTPQEMIFAIKATAKELSIVVNNHKNYDAIFLRLGQQ